METNSKQDELEVPSGRIYFADIIKTEYGLFESLDALLLWVSEQPKEIAGSHKTYLRSYRDSRHDLCVVFICEDIDDCDCSWQIAYSKWQSKVRQIKEQGGTDFPDEPDYDTTPKHQADCEETYTIDYDYVDLGTLVK